MVSRVSRPCLAPVQPSFAPVQNRVALVQDTLGRPSPQLVKTPLHPLPTTLGCFEVSDPCSRHSGSQIDLSLSLYLSISLCLYIYLSFYLSLGVRKRVVSERVSFADVPRHQKPGTKVQKPEREYKILAPEKQNDRPSFAWFL